MFLWVQNMIEKVYNIDKKEGGFKSEYFGFTFMHFNKHIMVKIAISVFVVRNVCS